MTEHTPLTVEQVFAAARAFSDRRAQHEEIRATPNGDRTRVEITGVRHDKGAIIGAIVRLVIGRRVVADHLRHSPIDVERGAR